MFPEDILTAYHFTKKAAEQFKNEIQVWEAWNEPELLGFNKEAPWEYASMMKAAYLGFKAGAPDHPVTNGSYCLDPAANEFAYAAFRNDLADYADIFNFHNYKLFWYFFSAHFSMVYSFFSYFLFPLLHQDFFY